MNPTPLQLLQFTDTHLFADAAGALLGVNTEQSLQAVLNLARQRHWPPDLVLTTGDLVHDGSVQAYARFLRHFSDLGVPVYCLPGNHDDAPILRARLQQPSVRTLDHVVQDHWQFCLLDTSVPGSEGGHLAEAELQRLDAQLTAHPDHHALVCLHHQPVPMGSRWLDTMAVDNADALFAVLDRHPQVRGLLWGHVHQDFHQQRQGVQLIASPSTCIQFAPVSTEFAIDDTPPGYRWLRLHADGRIDTGVERIADIPAGLERASHGY
jgi:3',5'-cyclic-AMP phosphodiesterase